MSRRAFKIAAVLAAVLLPLVLAAPRASAATHATRGSGTTCGPGGPPFVNGECQSRTWAGYMAIGQSPYNTVSAAWTQPARVNPPVGLLCYATGIWVGIGGGAQGDKAPVQVGTVMTDGCPGKSNYSAFYETPSSSGGLGVTLSSCAPIEGGGATTPCSVSAGDAMYAEVDYLHGGFQMSLSDYTANWSWRSGVISGNYSRDTAEVIVEDPSALNIPYPLAPFKSVQFNAVNLGLAVGLTMVNFFRQTLVSVSGPSGCCSFTATYRG